MHKKTSGMLEKYGTAIAVALIAVLLLGFQELAQTKKQAEQSRVDIYRIKVDGGEAAYFKFEGDTNFGAEATQNKRWLDTMCDSPAVVDGVIARLGEPARPEVERLCQLSRRAGIH